MTSESYDAASEAKRLLRTIRSAALSTLDPSGAPFTSLTAVATLPDGSPILLLSQLASHTQHLACDRRCSILLAEAGRGDPLAHPRLTLLGTAEPAGASAEVAARRFLSRNPKAELYAGFPDFSFWVIILTGAHLNGGFAKAARFTAEALCTSILGCDELLQGEAGAVAHINADHADAVASYATELCGLPAGRWLLSGLDPEGADLICGDLTGRLVFPERISTLAKLRHTLVQLAAEARGRKELRSG